MALIIAYIVIASERSERSNLFRSFASLRMTLLKLLEGNVIFSCTKPMSGYNHVDKYYEEWMMRKTYFQIFTFSLLGLFFMTGCATTKARHAVADAPTPSQVATLQAEIQAKDQQIQDLQTQLQSRQESLSYTTNVSSTPKNSKIRVTGVTLKDVQKALVKAGYDPGAVDGQWGKKTKSAIKKFQRKKNLKADGIVGEKTWSLLNG